MEYVEIKNSKLVIKDEYGDPTEIALEKLTNIKSSITTNIQSAKLISIALIVLGSLLTLNNIKNNFTERPVPESQLNSIFYERGYDRYKIQPGGDGTSIYPVHIGDDGKFYYSKNMVVFVFSEFFIGCIILFGFIKLKRLQPDIQCFKDNLHTISVFVIGVGKKEFFVGDFDKTKEVFTEIKSKAEKAKLQ